MNDEFVEETEGSSEEADDVPATWSTPPVEVPSGGSGVVWVAIALLVAVAGAVYVYGSVTEANRATTDAQQRAERTLKEYDPNEFTSEFEPSESIPLVDDDPTPTTTAEPADPSSEGDVDPDLGGAHPGVEIDPRDIVLAFINRVPGDEYGRVGYLDGEGTRHLTELECARIDLNESAGVCLAAGGGIAGGGRGLITDAALVPKQSFGLTTPSRAAVSPSGSVVAWTGFTRGHSYLDEGEFATLTQLISVERRLAADLETAFTTHRGDDVLRATDRNYWGVTFVDDDHFYATVGFEATTSVVEGRVSNSRLDVVYENATCPEVSPDGSTLVVKELRGDTFQLVAIDVESGTTSDLGETRSVDDQVEWVDNDTILYGLPNVAEGTDAQPVFDIWAVDTTPGATPRLLVPFADSPAV